MAILIDEYTSVLVQGITGRQGRASTELMKAYGTNVVAGVTPGKGRQQVDRIPVFDHVTEAIETCGAIDVAIAFVPGPHVKSALIEAIQARVQLVVAPVDRMPVHDVLEVISLARAKGIRLIGPNTAGLISPGKSLIGMLGGDATKAKKLFPKGPVGVMSRSGGMTTTICYFLAKAGIGQSTVIGVGGDAIIGSSFPELLPFFQEDSETKCVAIFGEIGTTQEERVAQMIKKGAFRKPVIAYIAGISAPEGTRFSHSAAIVSGQAGTALSKIKLLKEAGAFVVDDVTDFPTVIQKLL